MSLDVNSTTDFKMLENNPFVSEVSFVDPKAAVVLNHDWKNASSKMVDSIRSVIVDENKKPRKDRNGNLLYKTGPHSNDLPGKIFFQPDKKSTLPNHMTVAKCLDDFDTKLDNNDVHNMQFQVRFIKDDQEDIMSYDKIVYFMTRETSKENEKY